MKKLFISHASEDKESFARPLALELSKHFEVWYDEFELKLGDSLRSKIDEGLRSADFGVVVLSPSFFLKKWTVAETNGLFALEDENRKIILPVWYEVSDKEVRDFSPILADRLAVHASRGIEAVVEEIKIAVGVSARTQEVIDPDVGKRAIFELKQRFSSFDLDSTVLGSERGAGLFSKSIDSLGRLIWERVELLNSEEKTRFAFSSVHYPTVRGPFRVNLSVYGENSWANTAREAKLVASIYLAESRMRDQEQQNIDELRYYPTCISEDTIGYRIELDSDTMDLESLASELVKRYCDEISKQMKIKQIDNQSW